MSIELLHIDCMEYMAGLTDKAFDLAIVDPPYGIDFDAYQRCGGSEATKQRHTAKGKKNWDSGMPGPDYFSELKRVSKHQIIWGGNYFPLPPTQGFIFWHKGNPVPNFSDGEHAWTSFQRPAKCFDYRYYGNIESKGAGGERIHPTQKPVALYRWLLQNYAKPGQRILDTHLGSGSIAIACDVEGFDLVGCEIDADYIAAARKRLADHQAQLRMFAAEPSPAPVQLSIE